MWKTRRYPFWIEWIHRRVHPGLIWKVNLGTYHTKGQTLIFRNTYWKQSPLYAKLTFIALVFFPTLFWLYIFNEYKHSIRYVIYINSIVSFGFIERTRKHLPEKRTPPLPVEQSVARQQQQHRNKWQWLSLFRKSMGGRRRKRRMRNISSFFFKYRNKVIGSDCVNSLQLFLPADVVAFEALQSVAWVGGAFAYWQRLQIGHQKVDGRFQLLNVEHLHLFEDESRHQFPILRSSPLLFPIDDDVPMYT